MLVKLYGRKALVLHDGKSEYRAVSGVLAVPPSLVERAIGAGFSRSPFVEEDVTTEVLAPVADSSADVPPVQPVGDPSATQPIVEAPPIIEAPAIEEMETPAVVTSPPAINPVATTTTATTTTTEKVVGKRR